MGRKDDEPKIVVSPDQLKKWMNGEERAPKYVRNRLRAYLNDPTVGFPFDEKSTDPVLDSYYQSLPPVPTSELPKVDKIINDAIDSVLGRPEGTTTWNNARKGDPIAKEIIRRESRRPRRGPSK